MGLRNILHKIKIGFVRMREPSIPRTTQAKRYGDSGERALVQALQKRLPDCRIKMNVIIRTSEGSGEIDCLVLYQNKLFAIEIKSWKGRIREKNGSVVQTKIDQWTGEHHMKQHKSPFKQLARAIYLLRQQIQEKAWINSIVFFEDADSVSVSEESVWFTDVDSLAHYIMTEGRISSTEGATRFFGACIPADYVRAEHWGNSLRCLIYDTSLRFQAGTKVLTRKDIQSIDIEHYWSYDNLLIHTRDGHCYRVPMENGTLYVYDNGHKYGYALCKMAHIELGARDA